MGTVTAYNMANIQSALGGSNPISLSEYYRGGAYVPTTRSTVVREPSSGEYYTFGGPTMQCFINFIGAGVSAVYWPVSQNWSFSPETATSYTTGGYTYYRGSFRQQVGGSYFTERRYGVYRTSGSTVSINTGVPSSGQISISQLYGAENP